VVGAVTAGLCLLGVVGQVVRDAGPPPLPYLFYLPALHLGLTCMVLDGVLRGRTVRPRWGVFAVGLLGCW
jgi:hypothetical protein